MSTLVGWFWLRLSPEVVVRESSEGLTGAGGPFPMWLARCWQISAGSCPGLSFSFSVNLSPWGHLNMASASSQKNHSKWPEHFMHL